MAVKIKLTRLGKIRNPQYRIIVADARTRRDGRAIEVIGRYHPKEEPSLIEIDSEPRPSIGTVPHRCTARLALRLLPGESRQSVSERIAGALCGMEGMSLKFTTQSQTCWTDQTIVLEEFIPAWKNADSPLQREILDTLQTTAFAAPYTTNASAAAARGIPTFLLGPGAIDQAHTIDEWISLDQLNAAVDAYTRVIRTCLKGQTMNR